MTRKVLWAVLSHNSLFYLQLKRGKDTGNDYGRNQREYSGIKSKGETIERVKGFKYLGIPFDDKLSWNCHVDAVVKKVHNRLYYLRKLRSFDEREDISQLYSYY